MLEPICVSLRLAALRLTPKFAIPGKIRTISRGRIKNQTPGVEPGSSLKCLVTNCNLHSKALYHLSYVWDDSECGFSGLRSFAQQFKSI